MLWLVEHGVHYGRTHLNLSQWDLYSMEERVDLLAEIATQLRQQKMPLPRYLRLHPEAKLSESERRLVMEWAKSARRQLLSAAPPPSSSQEKTIGRHP